MTIIRRILLWGLAGLFILIAGFLIWVYAATYHPAEVEAEDIVMSAPAPLLPAGGKFKVLSWNVQFMAGNRDNNFFYSGGTDPWPSRERIEATVRAVAEIIIDEGPDIILLQEVDKGAARTHGTDQTKMLLELLPPEYGTHVSSYYWKADFVPHPAIMGAVGMKLVTISKYRMSKASRFALPAITSDDPLRRQFNLKRAVLSVDMPFDDGRVLTVLNTHLSAFAQGDDTMSRQIARVDALVSPLESANRAWLIGGDFNLLPSDAARSALDEGDRQSYNKSETELAPLLEQYHGVPSLAEASGKDAHRWYTHMPADDPDRAPNKTIDYIFYGDALALGDHRVRLEGARWISDHLPVIASFTMPPEQ